MTISAVSNSRRTQPVGLSTVQSQHEAGVPAFEAQPPVKETVNGHRQGSIGEPGAPLDRQVRKPRPEEIYARPSRLRRGRGPCLRGAVRCGKAG